MSKSSKTKSQKKRRDQKAHRKAQQRSDYELLIKAGRNAKLGYAGQGANKKSISTVDHFNGKCGNPGCKKCFDICFKSFLAHGKPIGMPHWMWIRWSKLTKEERKKTAA